MVSISLDPTTEEWQKDAALLKRVEGRKSVTAANGANHNVDPGEGTFIDISGPTAVFNITGFSGGKEGRFLIIFNRSGFALTLTNESVSSTAANRFTLGSDSVVPTKSGIILTYSGQDSRWIFVSRSGEVGVWTEAAGKVTLGTPGNDVGINEAAPSAKLEVKSDDADQKILIVKTGGIGGTATDPSTFVNGKLLLDAAAANVFEDAAKADPCEDADGIYTWDDIKNTADAVQATVALRPTWRSSHHGGESGADFDGSNDETTLGATWTNFITATTFTIIAVIKPDTFPNNAQPYQNGLIIGEDSAGAYCGLTIKTPDLAIGYVNDGGIKNISKGGLVTTNWNIIVYKRDASNLYVGVNDPHTSALASVAVGGVFSLVTGNVALGRLTTLASAYLNGALAYLIVFNDTKSEADLLEMFQHLATRYGISLSYLTGQAVNFFEIQDLLGNAILKFDGDGKLIVGNIASPTYKLELAEDSAGKPGTSTWSVVSDERLKREIADFNVGKNVLRALQPIAFKYKEGIHLPADEVFYGLSAQKVQKHFPQMVKVDHNGNLTLNYHAIFLMLINTIKELYERTDLLEARQSNMISSIQDLQSRLNALENP